MRIEIQKWLQRHIQPSFSNDGLDVYRKIALPSLNTTKFNGYPSYLGGVTSQLHGNIRAEHSTRSHCEAHSAELGTHPNQLELVLVDVDRRPVVARDHGLDQVSLDVSSRCGLRSRQKICTAAYMADGKGGGAEKRLACRERNGTVTLADRCHERHSQQVVQATRRYTLPRRVMRDPNFHKTRAASCAYDT